MLKRIYDEIVKLLKVSEEHLTSSKARTILSLYTLSSPSSPYPPQKIDYRGTYKDEIHTLAQNELINVLIHQV